MLESDDTSNKNIFNNMPLFDAVDNIDEQEKKSVVEDEIKNINLDDMAPRDALDFLYRIKAMLKVS